MLEGCGSQQPSLVQQASNLLIPNQNGRSRYSVWACCPNRCFQMAWKRKERKEIDFTLKMITWSSSPSTVACTRRTSFGTLSVYFSNRLISNSTSSSSRSSTITSSSTPFSLHETLQLPPLLLFFCCCCWHPMAPDLQELAAFRTCPLQFRSNPPRISRQNGEIGAAAALWGVWKQVTQSVDAIAKVYLTSASYRWMLQVFVSLFLAQVQSTPSSTQVSYLLSWIRWAMPTWMFGRVYMTRGVVLEAWWSHHLLGLLSLRVGLH